MIDVSAIFYFHEALDFFEKPAFEIVLFLVLLSIVHSVLALAITLRVAEMPDGIAAEVANSIGLFGVAVYLGSYALLQLGILRGQSYSYAALNLLAASSVLFSLIPAFNLSSVIIQVSWIVISIAGMSRLYLMTKLARYTEEEAKFVEAQLPDLPRHLAKRLLNAGQWSDIPVGTVITVEGQPIDRLLYLSQGQVEISVNDEVVGYSGEPSFIGELSFAEGGPATATAVVAKPARCFSIDADNLRSFLKRNPEISFALTTSFFTNVKKSFLQREAEKRSRSDGAPPD